MECLINPITNQTSALHAELVEIFGEEKAKSIYALTLSEAFKQDFGDWISLKDNTDSKEKQNLLKELAPRLGYETEPQLFLNEDKNLYYFKMQDGKKHYLDNNYINLNSEQKKALISNTIQYLSGDVISKEDLGNPDFNDLYKVTPENTAIYVLGGQVSALKELEQEVRKFYDINTRDFSDEVGVTEDESEQDNAGLGLVSSSEKNSKDNASANIKFMFSYIPKFDSKGELVTIEVPNAVTGKMMRIPQYSNYHEIWNYFEETLANVYPQISGGSYIDGFETMINKLRDKYGYREDGSKSPYFNPSVARLIAPVNGILSKFPDYKKKQFWLAFNKTKVNFYTTTISKDDKGGMDMIFFNSGDVTSRPKKIVNEFELGIQNGPLVNSTEGTYNVTKAKAIRDKFNSLITNVREEKFSIDEVVDYTRILFKETGIGLDKNVILNYFESRTLRDGIKSTSNNKAIVGLDRLKLIIDQLADTQSVYEKGKYTSPIKIKSVLTEVAQVAAEFRKDISENTLLGPDNKKYWAFSLPNYLHTKLQRIKQDISLENSLEGFYENSVWLDYLSQEDSQFNTFKSNFDVLRFLNLKLEDASDAGVDNKNISPIDQTVDMFNKAVRIRGNYSTSIINTPTPADKAQSQSFEVDTILDSGFDISETGEYIFSNQVKNVYKGYLKDEMNRINIEFDKVIQYKDLQDTIANTTDKKLIAKYEKDLDVLKENLYQYFHYGKNNELFTEVDGKLKPVGNFFKFTLFNELNLDTEFYEGNNEQFPLYDKSDEVDVITPIMDASKVDNSAFIEEVINSKLTQLLNDSVNRLQSQRIIEVNRINPNDNNSTIQSINPINLVDKKIFEYYLTKHGQNQTKAALDFIFESAINQHHANTEYNKVFSGDYAYYKSLDDYSKRVPATYTDGTLLAVDKNDPTYYTMSVMPDVKVDSEYLSYTGIDATDAQGYITFDRWKFITRRLNKYSPTVEAIIDRFDKGTQTAEDYKFAAQPVKGVYFDNKQGIPTYVKYSALPLIEQNTKGFKIDKLRKQMESNKVDEVVALSGVKVGAITTSEMMDENKDFIDDMKFYKQYLNNHSWKLQQDLSPKGMKQTLLGSQMQWNLMGDLEDNETYGNKTGLEIRNSINGLISKLSDRHLDLLKNKIGLDVSTGVVSNREVFYNSLLDELLKNGGDLNSIEALKREYPLDYILTNRNKFQNLISAVINNAAVKIKTNGGSFIQASSHQWERDSAIDESNLGDIVMLTNTDKLKPPRVINGVAYPGQVFISHQEISKYIPNYKELAKEGKLKEMIDDKLRYIVGYRIPNQDLASNDALEIVGILPESMGDTILPYIDITTKTGSDFDIDKMYLFLPNMKPVYSNRGEMVSDMMQMPTQDVVNILVDNGWTQQELANLTASKTSPDKKLRELVELAVDEGLYSGELTSTLKGLEYYQDTDTETIKGIENKLLEEFINILNAKELHEQLVKSIDNTEIKDDLKKLHNIDSDAVDSFLFFSPLYQVEKKFDNSAGKAGTGIWSNNKVDHVKTQTAKLSMNEDLGVGNFKDGVTRLDGIYDVDNSLRIGEAISLFLTANVDIAKDPYITKGNYTPVSYNTAALLLRAGTPYKWMNRFMGQPIIKQFVELEAIKDSRTNPINENVVDLLEKEIWTRVKRLRGGNDFESYKTQVEEGIAKVVSNGEEIRKHKKFKEGYMENHIKTKEPFKLDEKITYHLDQLMYLKLYERYNKIANKFNSTVVNSKADVNGAKSNFISNYNYLNKYNKMFDFKSETEFDQDGNPKILFQNLREKFNNTFLGTKHENSTELVDRIFEKELITANNKAREIYEAYMQIKPFASEDELVKLESSLFGFITSKNNFLNLEESKLKDLISTDKLHSKINELKIKYPDNVLLEYLEFDKVDGFNVLKMDNFKNKPITLKDDLIRSWQLLHEKETKFSEDLIKYAFATSNFQFNSNTFFEYIPYNITKDIIGDTIDYYKYKDELKSDEFLSFFFRHNPELAPNLRKVDGKIPYMDISKYGSELVLTDQLSPYLKLMNKGKIELYERASPIAQPYQVTEEGDNSYIYIKKSKLGFKKNGYSIYEHTLPKVSLFTGNQINRGAKFLPNVKSKLEEISYKHSLNTGRTEVSGYYLQPKEVTAEQLVNINRVLNNKLTTEQFSELTRTEQEYLINCHG